jgi:AraC family transcriptional activator FtrA
LELGKEDGICGLENRAVRAPGGITTAPRGSLSELQQADTIIIPGCCKPIATPPEPLIHALLEAMNAMRVLSHWVGALVLGATGLLNGRHATTHWKFIDRMARAFPLIRIQPDVLYVDEQDILNTAGCWWQSAMGPLCSASFAGLSPRLSLLANDLRTVLAVKGPLRRAQQRRALDGCGPVLKHAS